MGARTFFGTELRTHRKAAGMTQTELAEHLNYSVSMINKVELGIRLPTDGRIGAKADALFRLPGVLARAERSARDETTAFVDYLDSEARATRLRIYDPLLVPGLLQTPEYARATIEAGDPTQDADAGISARLARRGLLARPSPPSVRVIIDESVLYRRIGDVTVMRDQLGALLDPAGRTVVQVLPLSAGAHPAMDGPLNLLDFGDEPPLVYVDGWGFGTALDGEGSLDRAQDAYDALTAAALTPETSAELIAAVMEEQWAT